MSASENLHAFTATQALVAARKVTVQDPPLPAKARSQVAQFKVDSATWHPIRRTILNVGPRLTFTLNCHLGKTHDHRSRGDTTWRAQRVGPRLAETICTCDYRGLRVQPLGRWYPFRRRATRGRSHSLLWRRRVWRGHAITCLHRASQTPVELHELLGPALGGLMRGLHGATQRTEPVCLGIGRGAAHQSTAYAAATVLRQHAKR